MLSSNQIARFLNQPFLWNKWITQPIFIIIFFLDFDKDSQKSKVDLKCFGWSWSQMGKTSLVTGL